MEVPFKFITSPLRAKQTELLLLQVAKHNFIIHNIPLSSGTVMTWYSYRQAQSVYVNGRSWFLVNFLDDSPPRLILIYLVTMIFFLGGEAV